MTKAVVYTVSKCNPKWLNRESGKYQNFNAIVVVSKKFDDGPLSE